MHPSEFQKIFEFEAEHWWFEERRQVLRYLLERFVPKKSAAILDVGCGTGHHLLFLRRLGYGQAVGVDIAPLAIAFCARQGLANVRQADAAHLPYGDGQLEVLLVFDVLEHLADDAAAMREFGRVLKPGGVAMVTVPAFPFLWSRHDVVLEHYRRYRIADVRRLAAGCGFTVAAWSYFFCAIFPAVVLYRAIARLLKIDRTSDLEATVEPLNTLLKLIGSAEVAAMRSWHRLPFGTSLAVVLRKR